MTSRHSLGLFLLLVLVAVPRVVSLGVLIGVDGLVKGEHEDLFEQVIRPSESDSAQLFSSSLDMLRDAMPKLPSGEQDRENTSRSKFSVKEEMSNYLFNDLPPPDPQDPHAKHKLELSFQLHHHPTTFSIKQDMSRDPEHSIKAQQKHLTNADPEHLKLAHEYSAATHDKIDDEVEVKKLNYNNNNNSTNRFLSRLVGKSEHFHVPDFVGVPVENNNNNNNEMKTKGDIGERALSMELTVEGVDVFADNVRHRTLRLLSEEPHAHITKDRHGRDIGTKSESTFFIMPILKLIIAPFVCLIMMVVIGPAEGGMKNAGGGAIVSAGGGALAKIIGTLIGFVLGLILAWVMGNVLVEACTFLLTAKLTYIVLNTVFEQTAMDTVDNLNTFFMNSLLPTLQVEVIGYLEDIISEALHSALHHTVTRVVATRLSKSLTPVTLHYYYCVYCYYYGDYCKQCFTNNEQNIIDQLTWSNFGS